jgi:hypothetical protein
MEGAMAPLAHKPATIEHDGKTYYHQGGEVYATGGTDPVLPLSVVQDLMAGKDVPGYACSEDFLLIMSQILHDNDFMNQLEGI